MACSSPSLQPDASFAADLHMHSTASDGKLKPGELIHHAHQQGLTLVALTDHETLSGIPEAEATAKSLGMRFIPGVEINTAGNREVHVLLYFVHAAMTGLVQTLQGINRDRRERCLKFIERFKDMGFPFTEEELQIPPGTHCNRPHIARVLVRKGYVRSDQEAFERYLAVGKPGYIPRVDVATAGLIELARKEGAVPVLAHPGLIREPALKSREALLHLKHAGLMGLEAYHPKHTPAECRAWDQMARSLGLLVTGGSDYHGSNDDHGEIGSQVRRWASMREDALLLMNQATSLAGGRV